MSYDVFFLAPAGRDFLALPRTVRDLVIRDLEALADDPRPPGSEAMTGDQRGRRKLRVGDYRAVYRVDDKALSVAIIAVAHRSRAYQIAARRRG
jgi:mRNA interferase RelE/StbE